MEQELTSLNNSPDRIQGSDIKRDVGFLLQQIFLWKSFFFLLLVKHVLCNTGKVAAGLSGFEPELEAPEASVLSRLHYKPIGVCA